jgi:hypothetical protein
MLLGTPGTLIYVLNKRPNALPPTTFGSPVAVTTSIFWFGRVVMRGSFRNSYLVRSGPGAKKIR